MILLIGDRRDVVVARVSAVLKRRGAKFVRIDERLATGYLVQRSGEGPQARWHISGGECNGRREVGAIFVRHRSCPVSGTPARAWHAQRAQIDLMLLSTSCSVMNRPSSAMQHYSKPCQLVQLAAAGLQVPRTLVTNDPAEALRFILELRGRVIMKGVSSVKTLPRPFHIADLQRLRTRLECPVQFQEFIVGDEFRLTVVDGKTIATSITGTAAGHTQDASAVLPADTVHRCVAFTKAQGLALGGIDLLRTTDGGVHVLELNPFPLFTHHESKTDPVITDLVVNALMRWQDTEGDVLA